MSFVSALNWDNKKDYDSEKREVTITNALGFGGELFRAQLLTPHIVQVIDRGHGILQKVGEFKIANMDKKDFKNTFGKVETYNKHNMEKLDREVVYKYRVIKQEYQSPVMEEIEGTEDSEILYYETHYKFGWVEFSKFQDLPDGEIVIGVFVDVKPREIGEWIPTFFGREVGEWATWTSNFNENITAYYSLNETSGTKGVNVLDGNYNLTGIGTVVNKPGIIGTGFEFKNESSRLNVTNGLTMWNNVTKNLTLSFWFNKTNDWKILDMLWHYGISGTYIRAQYHSSFGIIFVGTCSAGTFNIQTGLTPSQGNFTHFVFQFTGDGDGQARVWINGTLVGTDNEVNANCTNVVEVNNFGFTTFTSSQAPNGTMDEIGWWDRYLSQSEIEDLYNNGAGITFIPTTKVTVTLSEPDDNAEFLPGQDVSFVINTSTTNTNLVNVTLNINGVENQTINISGTINSTTFVKSLPVGVHSWNATACDDVECRDSATRTLTIQTLIENSQTFNNFTLEGSLETFLANISLGSGFTISQATLFYHNLSLTGESFILGNETILRKQNFLIPNIVDNDELVNFTWQILLSNASTFNLTTQSQNVSGIAIDDCGSNAFQLFNFTSIDEGVQTIIPPVSGNTTIDILINIFSLDRSTRIINFSGNFSEINPVEICLSQNLSNSSVSYFLDSTIKYQATGYEIEYYNIASQTINNQTGLQQILLFDLLTADSTEFQITFTGSDFIAVEDALIFIKRQYVDENVFKVVEIPKTDSSGQTVAHLVRNDIVYNIDVTKNGVVIGSFSNIIAFCDDLTIGDCRINLDASTAGAPIFDYDTDLGITFTNPAYNNLTRVISFNFLSVDGNNKNVSLNATRNDIFGNVSVCSSSLVSSGGTLTCTVPTHITNSVIIIRIFVNDIEVIKDYITLTASNFGKAGYFIFFVYMLSLILMFGKSKETMLIGIGAGFISGIGLGLINGKVVGLGASGIWLILIIILMLWKLNEKRPN